MTKKNSRISLSRSRSYLSWSGMLNRCNNTKSYDYKWYGAKGIKVCKRWHIYSNFLTDMGERPLKHSLDRIDFTKGYSPNNCKWSTDTEQARNRSNNVFIEYKNQTKCIKEWALIFKIVPWILYQRLKRGWDFEKAITTPNLREHFIEFKGEIRRISEWARILNISRLTLTGRLLRSGWSIERALTKKAI